MAKSATDAVSLFSSTANKLPNAHNAAANTNSQRINPTAHLSPRANPEAMPTRQLAEQLMEELRFRWLTGCVRFRPLTLLAARK